MADLYFTTHWHLYIGRPPGWLEGEGINMTQEGEGITWKGLGVGKFGPGGAVSYRGMLFFRTNSQKIALGSGCGAFEYEVDAAGSTIPRFGSGSRSSRIGPRLVGRYFDPWRSPAASLQCTAANPERTRSSRYWPLTSNQLSRVAKSTLRTLQEKPESHGQMHQVLRSRRQSYLRRFFPPHRIPAQ
jgi:hypothetical protein